LFPILNARSAQLAGDLSGGEQQMLSLGMAFLIRPRLLCIDELSLGLAPTVVETLIDAVAEFHRQGTTILIVEQSVNVALRLAERATFLEKGTVRFTGPARDLLDRPDLLRAVFIGGPPEESALPGGTGSDVMTSPGHRLNSGGPDFRRESGGPGPLLQCRGVTKRFGGIVAVDGVSFEVAPREIVGLIGHNGAGKTTLFDMISGFLKQDGGSIFIDDEEVTEFPPHERAICGLGRSFQEARLFPSLTVSETVSVALERHLDSREPFAAAFRMPASTDSEFAASQRVIEILEMLGLTGFRERPTSELSTGTRRIVELACVIAQRPSLLLLDEPSAGVAQSETQALGPMLRRVSEETGCAIVVIEHDMALLTSLCDRLIALELGSIIADGIPGDVLAHPEVIASYLGTDPVDVPAGAK
jgi:ABC-type branched-subunit amino acid transport system ATPase component